MTLTSSVVRLSYNGDGSTTSFAVTFNFWALDDLRVILRDADDAETVWTRGTEYTVTGGDGSTGTIEVETTPTDHTPASGETLVILSNVPDTQETSLPLGGPLPSSSIEQELDKTVRRIQQQEERLGRALKFSEGSPDADITFPDVTGNAEKVPRVNTDGDALEFVELADLDGTALTTPLDVSKGGTGATTASAARTALGLGDAATGDIGDDVQAHDDDLDAIAGLTSAADKIIRYTGSGTADLIDFLDEDDLSSDSATAVASQQSIKAYVDDAGVFTQEFTSSATSQSAGALLTIAHGLGVKPKLVQLEIENTSAENNWSVGDKAWVSEYGSGDGGDGSLDGGFSVYADTTNVYVRCGNGSAFRFHNKNDGNSQGHTRTSWDVIAHAFA